MKFVYLIFFGYLALTALYGLISVYSRSVRREKLEKHWDRHHLAEGGEPAERTAFVEAGMADYQHGFRRKLIVLVYVLPTLAVIAILIAVNYN